MKPILYVGNRNYSSWSMRPWLALAWAKLDFDTQVIPLGGAGYGERKIPAVLAVSPAGTVPALSVDVQVISDSLAICEWAAELVPSLWPSDRMARAQARAAVCEMHSSFSALRSTLPCNVRRRAPARVLPEDVARDVARIEALWTGLRERYGTDGPYLLGPTKTIADAFYTPVATRFRTYAVPLSAASQRYVDTLLSDPDFRAWEAEAVREPWTIAQTEAA
jgi:glutathione S-transferase